MPLNADEYSRSIALTCPTCGNTEFSHEGTSELPGELLTCSRCSLEISKDDLVRTNSENLAAHVKEIGQELVADVQKELRDSLRKAFAGSKSIKIR